LVNVHEGFTRRLAAIAEKKGTVKAFIDGSYGGTPDLRRFHTNVLVAGGSGVSYTLPVLLEIIERVRVGKSVCRKVVFIWAIRDAKHITWISAGLATALQVAPSSLSIEVQIYVTGTAPDDIVWDDDSIHSGVESTNEKAKAPYAALLELPSVELIAGRPDLKSSLKYEVEKTKDRKLAVSVCGGRSVAEAVRSACGYSILEGGASVSLFTESFGYA